MHFMYRSENDVYLCIGRTNIAVGKMSDWTKVGWTNVGRTTVGRTKHVSTFTFSYLKCSKIFDIIFSICLINSFL